MTRRGLFIKGNQTFYVPFTAQFIVCLQWYHNTFLIIAYCQHFFKKVRSYRKQRGFILKGGGLIFDKLMVFIVG